MAPNGAGRFFFPANPDLADILGRTDFDFENFYFLDPKFPDIQVPNFQKSGLGQAWAGLGPGWARLERGSGLGGPGAPAGPGGPSAGPGGPVGWAPSGGP